MESESVRLKPVTSSPIASNRYQQTYKKQAAKQPFSHHFESALQPVKSQLVVSKHAMERLEQRNIQISGDCWAKIEEKVSEAKKMGVNDSLVLIQDAALIVSAKNNTVITALDRGEASSQIFTNINGTIVLE
ncbi:TIGR02530 family flagellar biosynthesis protein [Bacillota bacterium Lsc_1132]